MPLRMIRLKTLLLSIVNLFFLGTHKLLLSRKCPSLEKRGEGRFLDNGLITKIPPNLPFPKGGISGIFMLICRPKGYARFISYYFKQEGR